MRRIVICMVDITVYACSPPTYNVFSISMYLKTSR